MKICPETSADSCTFFVWPLDIVHVIGNQFELHVLVIFISSKSFDLLRKANSTIISDKDSPFFDLNATELSRCAC